MRTIDDGERRYLLAVARSTIEASLSGGSREAGPLPLPSQLKEKRGCFVTLHKAGVLRGCIGTIEPVLSLIMGVEENAVNAAFRDPRFPPLAEEELSGIDIEISVLTVPKALPFTNGNDLKRKLRPGIHGVILSRKGRSATFLPQVWEQLPEVEIFLEHLCQKAGLGKNCWQDDGTAVRVYEAEYFSEQELS